MVKSRPKEERWGVDYIEAEKTVNGKTEFYLKWSDENEESWPNSWEPAKNVDDSQVADFRREKHVKVDASEGLKRLRKAVSTSMAKVKRPKRAVSIPILALEWTEIALRTWYLARTVNYHPKKPFDILKEKISYKNGRTTRKIKVLDFKTLAKILSLEEVKPKTSLGAVRVLGGHDHDHTIVAAHAPLKLEPFPTLPTRQVPQRQAWDAASKWP